MVIAAMTVFALSVTALAADNDDNSITKRERFQHLVAQRQLCVQAGCLSIEEIKTLFAQKVEDGKLSADKAAAILERIEARRAACDGQAKANCQANGDCNSPVKAPAKAQANCQAGGDCNSPVKAPVKAQANCQAGGDCNSPVNAPVKAQANCQANGDCNSPVKVPAKAQANCQAGGDCDYDGRCYGQCNGDCDGDCDSDCNSQCNNDCGSNGSYFYDLNKNINNCLDNVQCLFKTQIVDCPQAK